MVNQNDFTLNELDSIFQKVFEHFNCSICLNELENTFNTSKCAHRFCENCIKTSVDQYHKCPLCNKELNYDDLVKDNQFDSLKSDLKVFKQKKIQNVLNNLVNATQNDNNIQLDLNRLSPIENVLKDHLIKTFVIHESYTNQIKANFDRQIKEIEKKTNKLIAELGKVFLDKIDIDNQAQILKQDSLKQKENLKSDYDRQIHSIAEKYKKFLEENNLTPTAMAVQVQVKLLPKNLTFKNVNLKPNDDVSVILDKVSKDVELIYRDKIIQIPENIIIFNFGPVLRFSNEEAIDAYQNYLNNGALPEGVDLISSKNCFPILEFSLKPDSEIIIFGDYKFESELPKKCFKYSFEEANPKPIDYFQCSTCNLKWICAPCIDKCHHGHDFKVFSLNHNSKWACCFCERNECNLKEN